MLLKKYIGTRDFYRTLFRVMIPILIQNGITQFISLLDNVMVGQVGTEQMSGVSIVNQLLFVFYLCIFGAISGAGLFGAQFYGKKDHEGVRHTFRFKIYVVAVLLAGAILLFLTCGDPLIELYLHEGGETGDLALTMQHAKEYLAISLIGLLPYALTQIYSGTLREIGHTVPPMAAGISGVLVNLVLNYVLIFGHFGAPALGVAGAAIATVISRFVECAVVMIWAHRNPDKCEFIPGVYRSFRVPMPLVKRIAVTGMPLMLNETIWAAGQAFLLQSYSVRGIAVVSAMNITNTLFNTVSVLFMAVGSAIAILLGHLLGDGKLDEARDSARKMIAFSIFMGVATGVIVAALSGLFPHIYNTTEEVRTLSTLLILVTAVTSPLRAYVHACYFTIRSGGNTWITFLFDSVFVWCVNVPIAFFLSSFTTMSITLVFFATQAADLAKMLFGIWLLRRGTWAKNITVSSNEEESV